MPVLLSLNIGRPERIGAKSFLTGIFKRPVPGPVAIGTEGLQDDAIIDRKHHGGPDQAVYTYFADDYDWWRAELEQDVAYGTFGENLTIGGVEGRLVNVGDRFTMDGVVLEVTSHRTPCMTLAARMGDPGFVRRFHKANRPGAYCRVIVPGMVSAGAEIDYDRFAGERISVAELMALDGVRDIPPAILRRALQAPVHYKMRHDFEQRLARLF